MGYNHPTVLCIDHIAIQTEDLERAIDFYCRILGATLLRSDSFKKRRIAYLHIGNTKIELYTKRMGDTLSDWTDYIPGPVHIAFSVNDIGEFLEYALEAGAKYHPSRPTPFVPAVEGAGQIAYLLGPDGEEVEIRSVDDSI